MKVWATRNKNSVVSCDCDPFSSNPVKSQLGEDSQPGPSI